MKIVWISTLLLTIVFNCISPPAHGQAEAEIEHAYGSAIHHYFRGDHAEAIELFTSVIQLDHSNPRPYFFRGLAHWKAGRTLDGQRDFRLGAYWEAQLGADVRVNVCRSLERVQGPQRMKIETARREARLAMLKAENLNSDVTPAMYGTDIVEMPSLKSWIDGAISTTPATNTPAPDLDEDAHESPVLPPTISPTQIEPTFGDPPNVGPALEEVLPIEPKPQIPDLKKQQPLPTDNPPTGPVDLGQSSTRKQRPTPGPEAKTQSSKISATANRGRLKNKQAKKERDAKKRPVPSIHESAKLPDILDVQQVIEELPVKEGPQTQEGNQGELSKPQDSEKPSNVEDDGPFEEIPDGDDN